MININRHVIYIVIVFLIGLGTIYIKHSHISQDIIEYNSIKNSSPNIQTSASYLITIHLAGAVKKPGVYNVVAGTRILDIIQTYSGTLNTANLDKINLAKIAQDGQRIYIPYKKHLYTTTDQKHSKFPMININTATQKQLEKIPGIGKKIAKELINYRHKNGFFYSIKDILNVKYIGTKMLQKISPFITI
tara:strand:- start:86 stop:655 length:570 start_codon:yes stop_codon:yes gene_type:complete